MKLLRTNSLDDIRLEKWRWSKFMKLTIETLSTFDLKESPMKDEFLFKESDFKSKKDSFKVYTQTWACRTIKLKQARAACVFGDGIISVMNLVLSPSNKFELPFFGADFVSLPKGYLLALDLQPVLNDDKRHTDFVWDKLIPLHAYWQAKLPEGGEIPPSARKYFSPGFLWTRLPLGIESDRLVDQVLFQAYKEYLNLYISLVNEAEKVDIDRANTLSKGQRDYFLYRAMNDPARGMLTRFYGKEWTESYIHNVLFKM